MDTRLTILLSTLASLVLTGCVAPNVDDPLTDHGEAVVLEGRAVAWEAPVAVGVAGYEPSLAVGDDGTLYLTAHKDLDRPLTWQGLASPLLVSRDGGTTWTPIESPLGLHQGFAAAEGDLAVDATGRLFFLDTYLADNHLHVFEDGGDTWAYSVPAQRTTGVDDRPWVTAQGDGVVHYLGNNGVDVAGGRVWYYRSTDGGLTFDTGLPVPGNGWSHLDAERHGDRVYIVKEGLGAGASGPLEAIVSNDRGATWEEPTPLGWRNGFGRNYPWVAVTDDGFAYALFDECGTEVNCRDDTGGREPNQLWASVTWNGGAYWVQRPLLNGWDGFADYPTICATEGGRVGVAFYGTEDLPVTDASRWYVYAGLAEDVDFDLRFRFDLARADADPVYVGGDLHALHDFLECAVTPDGELAVAYQRNAGAHAEDGERAVWFVRGALTPATPS